MKLQLAIDELSLDEAIEQIRILQPYIDIVEVGTPFLIDAGRKAVKTIKEVFPHIAVLCDMKIMDGGAYESRLGFEYGADYVTVLGVTDNLTIKDCVNEAQKYHKKIVVDMICVSDFKSKIAVIESLGVDVIAVHTGVDQQAAGKTPLDDLVEIKQYVKKAQIAVAGGINSKTINQYVALNPDIIIVGGGILNSDDPIHEAKMIKNALK
ncbi:3-hexulose-6-phosphate synthase [Gilliamella apicola SCGC AB-598-I20]|nr:3-hexulose-6-phosphate synthase [Gilliamella apicola SCGC AB-598-I20]